MDSRRGSRLPTPARSESSGLSTSQRPSADTHQPATMTQEFGSALPPAHASPTVQGGVPYRRSRSVLSGSQTRVPSRNGGLEPLDRGEVPLSSLPAPHRSDAHTPHFFPSLGTSVPPDDPYYYGRALRGVTASVPASTMNADHVRTFEEVYYNYSDVSSATGLPSNFGPSFVSAEARIEAQSLAPLGSPYPATPTLATDNVTYRFRPRYSAFRRALNVGNGGYGLRPVPRTMPTRLLALPEEEGVHHSDPGRYGPGPMQSTDITAWTEGVHYSSMHAGYPPTDDVDSYHSSYVPTREASFDTTMYTASAGEDGGRISGPMSGDTVGDSTVEKITDDFSSFYTSDDSGTYIGPDASPPPSSKNVQYAYPALFGYRPVSRPQGVDQTPVLQQPQPFRPFVMPEAPPTPSMCLATAGSGLSGSPTAQSGPQLAMGSRTPATSWHRSSRPVSRISVRQESRQGEPRSVQPSPYAVQGQANTHCWTVRSNSVQ